MAQKASLRIYAVTYSVDDKAVTIQIEGSSIAAYPLGDYSSSAFCVYGEDSKTPVLLIAWDSFISCRMSEEQKILQVKKSKKVISLEAHESDEDKERSE
jgi:hypothetical protein